MQERGEQIKLRARLLDDLDIYFETNKEIYDHNEDIRISTSVTIGDMPVSNAKILARLTWKQAHPGFGEITTEPTALPEVLLTEEPPDSGEYHGVLQAPDTNGYYSADGIIQVPEKPIVSVSKLISIEREHTPLFLSNKLFNYFHNAVLNYTRRHIVSDCL